MARREERPAEEPPRPAPRAATRGSNSPVKRTAAKPKITIQIDSGVPAEPESLWEMLQRKYADTASGYVVSLALHLVILTLLGLVVYQTSEGPEGRPGLFASFGSPDEIARRDRTRMQATQAVEIESVPTTSNYTAGTANGDGNSKTETPAEKATTSDTGDSGPGVGSVPSVGGAMKGRGARKGSLLQMFGGTKQSEDAVGRGLGWLARNQQSDGRWQLHKGYDNPGWDSYRTDTGATALSLLCFLGAGYTHQEGKHKTVVSKGLTWLRQVQKPNGNLHDFEEQGRESAFFAHAQATIVLCEAYALTEDKQFVEPVRKALQFIYDSQNENGGWQFQPGAVGDLSVTGWQFMALQSARMAGIEVHDDSLARANQFLSSVASQQGSRYRAKVSDPLSDATPAMTAEGLLCRQYMGWQKDHPALQSGVAWLLEDQNLPSWTEGRRNVYYWYYATQVMHNMGGDAWERWNGVVRDQIVSNQVKAGKLGGSWHPSKPEGDPLEYGETAGRLYVTCMSILTLEVYYSHLPLYRQDEKP